MCPVHEMPLGHNTPDCRLQLALLGDPLSCRLVGVVNYVDLGGVKEAQTIYLTPVDVPVLSGEGDNFTLFLVVV